MLINQEQIARRLGLSQATVAGSLANSPRFKFETRQRVLSLAGRLEYRPNRHARVMRNGRSGFIGSIQCAGGAPLVAQRVQCVAREVHDRGYHLLSNDAFWFADRDKTTCEVMMDAAVEGVVLISPIYRFEALHRAGIPMVGISGARWTGVPQVRADVRQGMYDLTTHLLSLGYPVLRALQFLQPGNVEAKLHKRTAMKLKVIAKGIDDLISLGFTAFCHM